MCLRHRRWPGSDTPGLNCLVAGWGVAGGGRKLRFLPPVPRFFPQRSRLRRRRHAAPSSTMHLRRHRYCRRCRKVHRRRHFPRRRLHALLKLAASQRLAPCAPRFSPPRTNLGPATGRYRSHVCPEEIGAGGRQWRGVSAACVGYDRTWSWGSAVYCVEHIPLIGRASAPTFWVAQPPRENLSRVI